MNFGVRSEAQNSVIPGMKSVLEKFNNKLIELEKCGAAAKLWVMYYYHFILKNSVATERSGDWSLYLVHQE